jgi:hypothetical protein
MTALLTDKDRSLTGGYQSSRLPLVASGLCFVGSLMTRRTDGFVNRLVAGEPFAGVAIKRIEAVDWPTSGASSGDRFSDVVSGRFFLLATLTVTQADAIKRRKVYASDDDTLTFTAIGNTYIGEVVEPIGTTQAVLECTTAENRDHCPGINGIVTLPDAPTTLDMTHVGKICHAPVTAARAYTLPPAADWIGKTITIINTGGAFAVTLTPNGAEKIGSAASLVQTATRGRSTIVMATGAVGDEVAILANQ